MDRITHRKLIVIVMIISISSVSFNFFIARDSISLSLLRTEAIVSTFGDCKNVSARVKATKVMQHSNEVQQVTEGMYSAPDSDTGGHSQLAGTGHNDQKDFEESLEENLPLMTENQVNASTAKVTIKIKATCPKKSPYLIGRLAGNHSLLSKDDLMDLFPEMELGGHHSPAECTPEEKVAIILPYRNRSEHLLILFNNLLPFLKRQLVDFRIFVVEQTGNSTFNRGALLNIGFLQAEKVDTFDCFIFHDVDLIPLNDHNLYRCGPQPRHFAVAMNKYKYKLAYKKYFGGAVGFSKEQYLKVNGNSNLYIGWGGEDDDLFRRLQNKNMTMARYDVATAKYDMIKHQRDEGNTVNPYRFALLRSAEKRQDHDGLNSVQYKVQNIRTEKLYTWIEVSLNNTELLEASPPYVRKDIQHLNEKQSQKGQETKHL